MPEKYRSQAAILFIAGGLLSPSIFFLLTIPRGADMASGIAGLLILMLTLLPAVASVVCVGLGIGRLIAARGPRAAVTGAPQNISGAELRRRKSDLAALIGVTILIGIVGLVMAAMICYMLVIDKNWFGFVFVGAVPVAVVVLAVVLIPLNIRKIRRERRALALLARQIS